MNKEEMQLEHNKMVAEIITKCDYMIKNRIYMNDIAIKKCAEEIKLIAKFYIMEAKQMNKKIKVIELLSEISKGKNPVFRKHGGTYKNSVWTFIISYFDKKMTHEEIVDVLNSEVEILEDEEEIDIENLEEIKGMVAIDERGYITRETFVDFVNKINDLVKAAKQLDKKINKEN